jgi:hypothetical protein
MAMITAGNTAHFSVAYVSTLGSAGLAMAQAVLAACEEDFATLSYLFAVSPPAGTLPFQINIVYRFAIIAASRNPKTFVVPSDPDFTTVLNAPAENGVRYLLAVPPVGRGLSDALNLRYPTLYETGADIATLQLEIPNDGDSQPNWRLYRVNEPVA